MAHGSASTGWGTGMWTELLVAHLADGTALDLLWDRPTQVRPSEREMACWDRGHDLDAALLHDLLRTAGACGARRTLHLRGVRIRGRLDLDGCSTPVALALEDCSLDGGIGVREAHLGGLALRRCRVGRAGLARPALDAAGMRLGDTLTLAGSLFLNGGPAAAVGVADAWIDGALDAHGAEITAAGGPALAGLRLHLRGGLSLDGGVARGLAPGAAVDLTAARIGGELSLTGALLDNPGGPALAAAGVETGHDLRAGGMTAVGHGPDGTIALVGARIGGDLRIDGARWENRAGPALRADRLDVRGDLQLTRLSARGAGPGPTVGLAEARVGGHLDCAGAWVSNASHPRSHWSVDGLTYTGIPRLNGLGSRPNRDAWLALLGYATPAYAARPYHQLAAAYRDAGRDRDVRAVLAARRRDHRARADRSRAVAAVRRRLRRLATGAVPPLPAAVRAHRPAR